MLVATQQARWCFVLHLSFCEVPLLSETRSTGCNMVDLRDEDDVKYFTPAEPIRPLKNKRQQHVEFIDLRSPTAAEGEDF